MKKRYIIFIIILAVIIVLLLFLSAFLYLKSIHIEKRIDDYNNFMEDTNINSDQTNIHENIDENNTRNSDNYISSNEALQVVLKSLGITQKNVYDLENELDYKYGTQVYNIDFKYNGYEYEFYVDAKTSKILKSFKERD